MSRPAKELRLYPTYKLTSYLDTVPWMLAEDTRVLGPRRRTLLLIAIEMARVSSFALVPQVPILMGRCEEVQMTQAHAVGCIAEEEP